MSKTLLRVTLCVLGCFAFLSTYAQKKTLDNVLTIHLKNMGAIYNKNLVSGYYMFYKVDKINRKTNSYLLRILDQNLNEVSESKIEESVNINLLEAAYNEESLIFKFYDKNEKKLVLYQYDAQSQLKSKSERKVESKYEIYEYASQVDKEESDGIRLFAVPGKGFVDYGMKKEGKLGYTINFYPENKGQKGWTYESPDDSKEVEAASFFSVSNDILISSVIKKKRLTSQDFNPYLLIIDVNTGKKRFEKQIEDNLYNLYFMNGYIDPTTGNIALLGQYFKKDDNVVKDKSLGLCSYLLDPNGNIITKNYSSWLNDVRKFLPVNAKGKIENVGYLYFHKMMRTADGKYFAIGEQYKKAASAGGYE